MTSPAPREPRRPDDRPRDEFTSALTPAMLAFYTACTVFGIAAAVAAAAFIVLPDLLPNNRGAAYAVGWVAVLFCVLSFAGSWYFLAVTRRLHGDDRG